MLETVRLNEKWKENEPCVMLLGGFDGMHVGHTRLLSRALSFGLPVGVMTIVGGKGQGIFTLEERLSVFSSRGADFAFVLPFDEIKDEFHCSFSQLLIERFNVQAFVCGEDFRFGKHAIGTPKTLKDNTRVRVEVEKLVEMNGEKVSTRTIKERLLLGDLPRANALLGERFFLIGKVEADRKVGRTLGFPTANIAYPKDKFPIKKGVYETLVNVDGKSYKGITNYGARPTFNDVAVWTETYLDGFSGDLYGRTLKVEFKRLLREIEKFPNAEALKAQLERDIRRIREND